MKTIAHIINPVKVDKSNPSYLYIAQPITFESMRNAKEYAKDIVNVELYTTQYPEDREIIPDYFNITSDLEKSIHDYVNFKDKSRKLPTLRDILQKLYDNSDAEYFIFTNADIGLKPHFYKFISDKIDKGFDSMCIHRFDMPKKHQKHGLLTVDNIDKIYELKGSHTFGHDCFVFKRDIFPKMKFNNVFVGYPPIGTVMRNQVKKNSKKFCELESKENLTFHIGFDKVWSKGSLKNEYFNTNQRISGGLKFL